MTLTLQDATGKSVLLLPIGASDDGAHSQNEKIDRINYINGVSIKEINRCQSYVDLNNYSSSAMYVKLLIKVRINLLI